MDARIFLFYFGVVVPGEIHYFGQYQAGAISINVSSHGDAAWSMVICLAFGL